MLLGPADLSCQETPVVATLKLLSKLTSTLKGLFPFPECSEACPEIFDPVCGTDGVTYSNSCELDRANCLASHVIEVASDGPCDESKED